MNLLKTIFPDDIGMSDQVAGIGKQDSNFLDFAIYHIQQNKDEAGLPGHNLDSWHLRLPASMAMRGELAWHDDLREGLDTYDETPLLPRMASQRVTPTRSSNLLASLRSMAEEK